MVGMVPPLWYRHHQCERIMYVLTSTYHCMQTRRRFECKCGTPTIHIIRGFCESATNKHDAIGSTPSFSMTPLFHHHTTIVKLSTEEDRAIFPTTTTVLHHTSMDDQNCLKMNDDFLQKRATFCCKRYRWSWIVSIVLASCQVVNGYQPSLPPLVGTLSLPTRQSLPRGSQQFQVKMPKNGYKEHSRQSETELHVTPATAQPVIPSGDFYMVLLALQFAFQPLATKSFTSKTIIKGTYVFWLDVIRSLICASTLWLTKSWVSATVGWHWRDAALAAGIPSMLYVAQNYFALQAYQNLSPITFNVLNQTKTLSAACWCFVLLGQKLHSHQVGALGLLLLAALIMECNFPVPFFTERKEAAETLTPKPSIRAKRANRDPWLGGILPVLLASLLSGLAGALAQRSLQKHSRNSLLFSLELAACSIFTSTLTLGILPTPDHRRIVQEGWWKGWSILTWIPLLLQAAGGVLVGLVTKYSGSVRKGFALIFGMFLSGILQNICDKDGSNHVRVDQWMGGILAALSFLLYTL